MVTIKVERLIAEVDYFEVIDKWTDIIQFQLDKPLKLEKLEFFYTFGSFLPKVQNREDFYINMWEETARMLWVQRLEHELSKIRVDLTMKMGNFSISDRMNKDYIPSLVVSLVTEITKLKMIFECEMNGLQEVKESIPPLDKDYLDEDSVRELLKLALGGEKTFDLDNLLDKISENGIESRYNSKKELQKESLALMQGRLERMKSVSEADILRAKLMQLKFKMEDYLKNTDLDY